MMNEVQHGPVQYIEEALSQHDVDAFSESVRSVGSLLISAMLRGNKSWMIDTTRQLARLVLKLRANEDAAIRERVGYMNAFVEVGRALAESPDVQAHVFAYSRREHSVPLLDELVSHGMVTHTELASSLGISEPRLTAVLQTFIKDGLVTYRTHGRHKFYSASELGRQVLTELKKQGTQHITVDTVPNVWVPQSVGPVRSAARRFHSRSGEFLGFEDAGDFVKLVRECLKQHLGVKSMPSDSEQREERSDEAMFDLEAMRGQQADASRSQLYEMDQKVQQPCAADSAVTHYRA